MNKNYVFNRSPLVDTPFAGLPLGSIKPKGWLYNQLKIQADGLTGHLEEIWDSVGWNSGWLGGSGENWERGPYYLDGLIPLAYLLDDENLIKKAQKWIEWTLNSQTKYGFFGPANNDDWWPRMVMLKVLIQYYGATEDKRVIPFMTKYFRYQLKRIEEQPLKMWAVARGGENILSIFWLYNHTGDGFLLELADKIYEQTLDWTEFYTNLPYKSSMKDYLDWKEFTHIGWDQISNPKDIGEDEAKKLFETYHSSHVVNVAMGLKEPGVYFQCSKSDKHKNAALLGIHQLMKYHGVVYGMWTGDEHLSGNNPTQGTELCAVVEYMFTLETLIQIFGETEFGDILERLAYNALPATIKPDFWAHQYDQQANQVMCSVDKRSWYNNQDDSNIFGLEPNFGCCTANMHQGWPKFVNSLWMATIDGGAAAMAYGPCEANIKVADGVDVTILEETDYPFDGAVNFTIRCTQSVNFSLKLRIPKWASNAFITVNGEKIENIHNGTFYTIKREWNSGDKVELNLPMEIHISKWFNDSVGIERGPLIFALRIEEEWEKLKGTEPYSDWEVLPKSPWNYGVVIDNNCLSNSFDVVMDKVDKQPFDPKIAPIKLIGKGKRIDEWKIENNSVGTIPIGPIPEDNCAEGIVLVPYGATNLRIAQFPIVE